MDEAGIRQYGIEFLIRGLDEHGVVADHQRGHSPLTGKSVHSCRGFHFALDIVFSPFKRMKREAGPRPSDVGTVPRPCIHDDWCVHRSGVLSTISGIGGRRELEHARDFIGRELWQRAQARSSDEHESILCRHNASYTRNLYACSARAGHHRVGVSRIGGHEQAP